GAHGEEVGQGHGRRGPRGGRRDEEVHRREAGRVQGIPAGAGPEEVSTSPGRRVEARVESVEVSAYEIPTEEPESDGTLEWDSTTIVVVEVSGGGRSGLGYTYGDRAAGALIRSKLAGVVAGTDPMNVPDVWLAMGAAIRNAGRPGVGMMAVSAVDLALWDLKARLLEVS